MYKSTLTASYLLTGLIVFSAEGLAQDLGEGLSNGAPSVLLNNLSNKYAQWNGIGKMFLDDMPACTVSLLDTREQGSTASGPAYVLTAAHCIPEVLAPGNTLAMKESVKFNYFNDMLQASKSYAVKQTVWSDYQQTDLAILELDSTLSTLLAQGVTPLRLASEWTKATGDVLVVGAPQELPDAGLRLAACAQSPVDASLVEDGRTYQGTLKNQCREIRSGSSGSPVLDRSSGKILSVIATTTFGAAPEEQCFEHAPCEVNDGQPRWSPDTHYAHPVDYLAGCFLNGVFTSVANACTPYQTFEVTDVKSVPTEYVAMPEAASGPGPFLVAEFSLSTAYYRYKTVRDAVQCRSPHYYSGAINGTNATINAAIPREAGMHFLCIIGIESADHRPSVELMKSAWVIPAQLIARTPVAMPEPTITLTADWRYFVKWRYRLPTHGGTLYFAGPKGSTDCNHVALKDFMETFERLEFAAEQLPLMLCSRNQDLTFRHSDVRSDLLALP